MYEGHVVGDDPVRACHCADQAVRGRRGDLVRLHEIHVADGSRIEHRRFCTAENREVPHEKGGRGSALADGRVVPLTEDDLAHLPLPTKRTIDVFGFVPFEDIDPASVVGESFLPDEAGRCPDAGLAGARSQWRSRRGPLTASC
ncbi:Ku protein [Streptomyces carpinensis]|uniref:Ku protein n=1 Tax=Streptomyces carpinensis TaxID=66369 RepID=A0ABV1W3T2_9ACTN